MLANGWREIPGRRLEPKSRQAVLTENEYLRTEIYLGLQSTPEFDSPHLHFAL